MNGWSETGAVKEYLRIITVVTVFAFVAYPTFTNAPIQFRVSYPIFHLTSKAALLFGGDIMLDRTIRAKMEVSGEDFIFSCVADMLRGADLVIANLEGPITDNPSMSLGSEIGSPENYTFTFGTSTAELLARHNIRLVNLGNNHIQNFGWGGVNATLEYLRAAEVDYFGDPLEKRAAQKDIHGVKLTFINYNEFAPEGWKDNASTTLAHIHAARSEGRLPIIYAHWGDEYAEKAPERVKQLAHSFIDAGVAIIIGSHPHIVQDEEVYHGKYIFYSLGNFIFDQYWSDTVRRGLLLNVEFTKEGVSHVEKIPIDSQSDRRPCAV